MTTVSEATALVREAQARIRDDRLGVHAGSMTYGLFLAIPPLLILGISALSIVLANDATAQQQIIDSVTSAVPGLDQVLHTQFDQATAQQVGIGLAGTVALLWAVSSFVVRVRSALGVVFRTGIPTLMMGRVSGTALGLLIVVGFATYATAAGWALSHHLPVVVRIGMYLAIVAVGFGLSAFVYWALTPPGTDGERPTIREQLPGAAAFLVLGILLEQVGRLYVANVVARSTALYGAIGAVFGLLAFLYVAMWTFLLGAEISEIAREHG
jgi:uncharacterized BrkB/YihY/UPF0761 family membrane protein